MLQLVGLAHLQHHQLLDVDFSGGEYIHKRVYIAEDNITYTWLVMCCIPCQHLQTVCNTSLLSSTFVSSIQPVIQTNIW